MSVGVFTDDTRVRFVEKDISECGDGTARPLEVTGASLGDKLDKIAEIFHRVKDAYFTAGSIDYSSVNVRVYAATSAPATRALKGLNSSYQERGYTTLVTDGLSTIPPENIQYLGEEYIDGFGAAHRDIADNEIGIHLGRGGGFPQWNLSFGAVVTAFSYSNDGFELAPSALWFYSDTIPSGSSYNIASGLVGLGSQIAYVLANPADTMFSPNTRFFLTLDFTVREGGYALYASTLKTDVESPVCNYVMRLAADGSRDLSCPMYPDLYSTYGGSASGSDFIHSATEWFPYAKGSPPTAVWDVDDGSKL